MKKINWEERRYELAKEAMGAMVANDNLCRSIAAKAKSCNQDWTQTLSYNAIELADEMIKQLKWNQQ